MDALKIGKYIQHQRKKLGLTQKELADKLSISFQAVSKWENGDALPDTGILLSLSDILETTVDKLLNGGTITVSSRKIMKLENVIAGFQCIIDVGKYFGEDSTFYTGMIDGINKKMNMDILEYLNDPKYREALYAEVLIQGILSGCTVDMDEVESTFQNRKMVGNIRKYISKTND